jgi:hypothetical protein
VLEHVFAPFLECCGDAVMFAKQNVVVDDEDDVTAMVIVFSLIKVAVVAVKSLFCDDFQMRCCVFLILIFSCMEFNVCCDMI